MENVHTAIAWYQTKIGSYDKQLWEQSVEKKLQKQPHFILHSAPRKKVHLKTEYIDVDIIRGTAFAKTKPQVPWVYVTRKAIARVLFFPFYYNWWVHQTSRKLYFILLILYILQVVTVFVYLSNLDHMEDELSFTEVILPTILMFLLCLIHSQTVLAHINHKPPKHNKTISGVTRKPSPKRTSHKARSCDNISACQEDNGSTDAPRISKRQTKNQHFLGAAESHSSKLVSQSTCQKNLDPTMLSSIDMEGSLLSRSVSDYDLKPVINSVQKEVSPSPVRRHKEVIKYDTHRSSDRQHVIGSRNGRQSGHRWGNGEINTYSKHGKWEDGTDTSAQTDHKSGCYYYLLDNLPNLLTVEKVVQDSSHEYKDEELPKNRAARVRCGQASPDVDSDHGHVHFESLAEEPACSINNNGSHYLQHAPRSHKVNEEIKMSSSFAESGRICGECKGMNEHIFDDGAFVHVEIPKSVVAEDKGNARICSHTHKSFTVSETNKSLSYKRNSCFREQLSEWSKTYGSRQSISAAPDGKENLQHALDKASNECPSLKENPSLSDFEMDNHYVIHERSFSSQRPLSAKSTSSSSQAMGHAQASLLESEPKSKVTESTSEPFMTQDSSNSDIDSSTLHKLVCSCPSPYMDTKLINSHGQMLVSYSTIDADDLEGVSLNSSVTVHSVGSQNSSVGSQNSAVSSQNSAVSSQNSVVSTKNSVEAAVESVCCDLCLTSVKKHQIHQELSLPSDRNSSDLPIVEGKFGKPELSDILHKDGRVNDSQPELSVDVDCALQSMPQDVDRSIIARKDVVSDQEEAVFLESTQLQCFSEQFAQEILNEDTLHEISCSSLLAYSDLENSSLSISCQTSASSASSDSSTTCKVNKTHCTPLFTSSSATPQGSPLLFCNSRHQRDQIQHQNSVSSLHGFHDRIKIHGGLDDEKNDPFEESLDQLHLSEEDRHSDDLSNYNPSDSDVESDGSVNEDVRNKYEEKWKKLRFQVFADESETADKVITSKESKNMISGTVGKKSGITMTKTKNVTSSNGGGSRSVVGNLTRKPSPLKDLTIGRKSNSTAANNSSGSDEEQSEVRSQLRRRRRTSGTPYEVTESGRNRNVLNNHSRHASEGNIKHVSSSECETGGVHISEESNKATMSSEEWEDRIQSDETTSSAYSSNSDVDCEEKVEEEVEEKAECATNTFHVINLLQPQVGSPSNSGNVTQPDRVSCMIWEGSEYKKMDLTALDIGWAIIDKVDSLPESSDYFLIGLSFSFIICLVPLVFRAYANRDLTGTEAFLTWSGIVTKLVSISALVINSYSWRQYLLMVNGIFQRFFLSLIFFFLLSVADRTFKQRLLYAKHFSYLTSSRRARKFSMPHFRLNKVRNIKIWLSLRSYLKRRGPQRSVDVIVSASFLFTVSIVCLISLQMLKETDSYLDYLCNWELLVWCIALAVFLMRFMTLGLQINKKYRNLSVLITEQINLYLQMEQKPHKKEELILANNVLRLAEDLLKELESPFKISGFSANPLIYNIMRIVVLSAFSAVLTEVLGFKLKLHKINFRG